MDLSIVIVNYNVRQFLEQCLHSVQRAAEGLEAEVIVVDNNSADGSVGAIRSRFPGVMLIENKENLGFSRANNQAIGLSSGRYVLLLNPDTVVQEDTFRKCTDFMDTHPEAGALGVKMINGRGEYLPESKRSLPTPMVSFYKMFGLAALFPRSKRFGRYHLGYLDRDRVHTVEVLAGAFMFLRRETLDKTGLLDESYFMYGEDIDLSYRITNAGYVNYYFPETTIIHYKGESTRKGSLNYVRMFYQAMIIFARKHFTGRRARSFSLLINLAIYFRAALSVLRRFAARVYRPLLDGALIFLGYLLAMPLWEQFRFGTADYYPPRFLFAVVPAYILVWLVSLYYSGGYDRPVRILSFLKGHLVGTLVILVVYALLPLEWRFSRALIFLGSLWAILITTGLRILLNLAGIGDYAVEMKKQKRMLIVGNRMEAQRVSDLLMESLERPQLVGFVSPSADHGETSFIGRLDQIDEIIRVNRVDEIVFCSRDLPSQSIIGIMTRLIGTSVDFTIAPPESLSFIGSNHITNSIGKASSRRNKRLFDLLSSLLLLVVFPFWVPFVRGHLGSLVNTLRVLLGLRTWVGYMQGDPEGSSNLPPLKKGILHPGSHLGHGKRSPGRIREMNLEYAKEYRVLNDLLIFTRNFRKI